MIEKLTIYKDAFTHEPTQVPSQVAVINKINEMIDKVNEIDIKLHTVKFFTSEQEDAIQRLLEMNNDAGELLKGE